MIRATIDTLLRENGMNKDVVLAILSSEVDRQLSNYKREQMEEARRHRYELAVKNVNTGKYTEEDLDILGEELDKREEKVPVDMPSCVFGVEVDEAMEEVLRALGIKKF